MTRNVGQERARLKAELAAAMTTLERLLTPPTNPSDGATWLRLALDAVAEAVRLSNTMTDLDRDDRVARPEPSPAPAPADTATEAHRRLLTGISLFAHTPRPIPHRPLRDLLTTFNQEDQHDPQLH